MFPFSAFNLHLSATFDCLDKEILCKKLSLYGLDENSVKWFGSFLSERSQVVKITDSLSDSRELTSGVPQGGIISPLLYIIYVADLQDWLRYVLVTTYADDTSTSISHLLISEVKRMLEEDALNVLKFMASNGLVANPAKTALLFLNLKKTEKSGIHSLKIGEIQINQVPIAKLLGVMINDDQSWNAQITGTGGMISSLNSRLFIIKRISAAISRDRLNRIVDSLYTSKLRYGLQLLGKVRTSDEDSTNGLLAKLQVSQNKLARFLNGSSLVDKICNKEIYKNINLLSVNQLNCQIKLKEVWKSINDVTYPIQWDLKPPPS